MSVLPSDIVVYGSANMPEADGAINGGAVDFSRRVAFYDIASTGSLDLTQLRRFEHFRAPKWLRLLRPTPKGRHYSGIGGTGPAVILGGGWAGNSSFSFSSKRLSSGSGSV